MDATRDHECLCRVQVLTDQNAAGTFLTIDLKMNPFRDNDVTACHCCRRERDADPDAGAGMDKNCSVKMTHPSLHLTWM